MNFLSATLLIMSLPEEKKQMMDIVKDAEKTALKVAANFNQQSIQKISKEIESRVRALLDEQITKKVNEVYPGDYNSY